MQTPIGIRSVLPRLLCTLGLSMVALLAAPTAQALELPRPSPAASVSQTVGITEVSVSYFSPGVKGRKIWGGLIPYGKIWRAGANSGTKITFSQDVTIGKSSVKAGSYYVYIVPAEKGEWSFFLSTDGRAWTKGPKYDTKQTVAQVSAAPTAIPQRERLAFQFTDSTDDATTLHFEWEKVRLSVKIATDTKKFVSAAIKKATSNTWRPYYMAGRHILSTGGDLKVALSMLETSIQLKENWWNVWFKALTLSKMKRTEEAIQSGHRALALGKGKPVFERFFKANAEKTVAAWQNSLKPKPAVRPSK
ncbi:MAG: DUF2911 domain-containing protein [Myxococcales bacterium]|nr:DUF2911 domain-containing protein [Myxococcales bacterium]MCB9643892.1 DUF2911 domain-containing protein [Myxococcales bacterium]